MLCGYKSCYPADYIDPRQKILAVARNDKIISASLILKLWAADGWCALNVDTVSGCELRCVVVVCDDVEQTTVLEMSR